MAIKITADPANVACRDLMKLMMRQNDIPFNEGRLQAVGFAEVYTRMSGNLINIYSHTQNASKQRILLDMLLAISPDNMEYGIRRAQVCLPDLLASIVRVCIFYPGAKYC